MISFDSWPFWLLPVAFAIAAAAVWIAGVKLSQSTDILDERLHLGSAFGGLIVLAVATNLPEIAITVSAAAAGDVEVAVGNILGGIALQTVVLVVLDALGKRGGAVKPLTYRAASLTLVLEGLVVVAILSVAIAGSQLPASLAAGGLAPAAVMITGLWVVGLYLVHRAGQGLPWHQDGEAPQAGSHPRGHRQRQWDSSSAKSGTATRRSTSTRRAAITFALAAGVTMAMGVLLERSGEAASSHVGLSGLFFGATVLSLATSLPEISTGLQAIRQGDDNLAMSDIFGGNAFLPVLFLPAALISGRAVLPGVTSSDIYLSALASLLTLVYVLGLIFRPQRRVIGMGLDSAAVLILYLLGVGGLIVITH